MQKIISIFTIATSLFLSACVTKGTNPDDPYEALNRKTYKFNQGIDHLILKPSAKFYRAVLPAPIRSGVNNAYNNVNMLPTVANDLLQADGKGAIKDSWRFVINSIFGIAGVLDVAKGWGLPPHSNDMGLTFAKWGDKKSPYIVIPLLGPSTFRDGMAMIFDYAFFTPYPYLSNALMYSLLGVRYVDLRSQMLDTEKLMHDAIDPYAFMRDAYLQHRRYLITGEQQQDTDSTALYVDGDEPANGTKSAFPLTTAMNTTRHHASA